MNQEEFEKKLLEGVKDFRKCNFKRMEIIEKDLSGCDFEQASFEFCKFESLNLRELCMRGANLYCCNLSRLKVNGGDWRGVRIADSRMSEKRENRWTDFPRPLDFESQIQKCDFKNVNIQMCNIHSHIMNCVFQNVDFEHSDLRRSHFWQVMIKNSKMQRVNLQEMSFTGTITNSLLRESDFRASLIQNSYINKCDMLGGRYRNALIRNVKMERDAIDRSFELAIKENIRYQNVENKGAILREL